MDKILKKYLTNGQFQNVPRVRSKVMQAIKAQGNQTTEQVLLNGLRAAGMVGFRTHEKLVGNPDIYFPHYQLVIFIDGCFWHSCPRCGHVPKTNHGYWQAKLEKNKQRDKEKSETLQNQGFTVLRFWEHELKDIEACIRMIKENMEQNLMKLIHAS